MFTSLMVPEAGLEPACLSRREILSLLCLPIPPFRQIFASEIFKNDMTKFSVGDLVLLKKTYGFYGKTAVITNIDKSTMPGDGGWICFAYQVVTESGDLVYITESCIKELVKK